MKFLFTMSLRSNRGLRQAGTPLSLVQLESRCTPVIGSLANATLTGRGNPTFDGVAMIMPPGD